LYWSGARISEVLGDPKANIPALTIAQGFELVEKGYVETVGKGGKRRVLVMPAGAREALRKSVSAVRPADTKSLQSVIDTLPLLRFGHHTAWATLSHMGLGSAYCLRHSFRLRSRLAGISEEVSSAMLGHGPLNVTQRYGKARLGEMQKASQQLSKTENP
jgi:site-specific recombinase XerD